MHNVSESSFQDITVDDDAVRVESQRREHLVRLMPARELPYLVLAAVLVATLGFGARNMDWGGDFWEHAAVVRELATNPFSPSHPQFAMQAPHHFYSPYAWAVGRLASAFDLNSVDALAIAGLFNAVLLVIGLRWLVIALLGDSRPAFWTLVCALTLWGVQPWTWSGFIHLRSLSDVLSYPSTFAVGATGLICIQYREYLLTGGARHLLPASGILAIIALAHPPTALACGILLSALHLSLGGVRRSSLMAGGLLGALLTALLVTAWPLFPFWGLFQQGTAAFDNTAPSLYEDILLRTFPAWIGLPLLVLRLRRNPRDPVVWAFVGLGGAYLAGLVTGRWQLGRMMPFVMLMLHIAIADALTGLQQAWRGGRAGIARYGAIMAGFAALLLIAADSWNVQTVVQQWLPKARKDYERYAFLSHTVGQYDVVIGDMWSSWVTPSFGGKIIASRNPQGFVPDHEQRKREVRTFFAAETSQAQRAAIVRKYGASYILLNVERHPVDEGVLSQLRAMGTVIHSENGLILIRIDRDRGLRGALD